MDRTSTEEWQFLAKPERGGHRFYKRISTGEPYVADDSGSTPDQTDDGPLRILTERAIHIDTEYGNVLCSVPVINEAGETKHFLASPAEAAWVKSQFDMKVVAIPALNALRNLLVHAEFKRPT